MTEASVASAALERRRAVSALLLLVPVPTIGVTAAMVVAPGPIGHTVFMAAKIWLVAFPAAWYLLVERGKPSWSPPRHGGLGAGIISGLAIACVIVGGALLMGVQTMDLAPLREAVREMGLGSPMTFLAGATGWTLANSLMEEYVYRWFVLRQCERLLTGPWAVAASAAVFTAHHVVAVSQYLDPWFTVLASTGVFVGGVIWAWLYHRYRSVWPCWLSHVLADVAVFGIGGWLLFG
jgi:membrane protease YdiL (CAAX protease family)